MGLETGWHSEADSISGCELLKVTVGHPKAYMHDISFVL